MGQLFDRLEAEKEKSETVDKYSDVMGSLFGNKPKAEAPQIRPEPQASPAHFTEQEEVGGGFHPTERFSQQQLDRGSQFMSQRGFSLGDDYRQSKAMVVNDRWLRSMAKMQVAKVSLREDFQTEPIRHLTAFAFEKLGDKATAEELREFDIEEGYEELYELMEEICFQEMKQAQEENDLLLPKFHEFIGFKKELMAKAICGKGFENIPKMAQLAYKRFTKK